MSIHFQHSRVNKKGFTLIELLVVIAIISVLASMLVPALGRARRQASLVSSASNLRQLGMVITTYAMDNDDRLPGPFYLGQRSYYRSGLSLGIGVKLWEYMGLPRPTAEYQPIPLLIVPAYRNWDKLYGPYSAAYEVNRRVRMNDGSLRFAMSNPGDGSPTMTLNELSGVDGLSDTWAIWEFGGEADPHTTYRNTYPEPLHGDSRTVLFFDWHVEILSTYDSTTTPF